MRLEIDKARKRGIPIEYFNSRNQEVESYGKQKTATARPDEL
jgi:hypothetical protein